jgi:hypothetical protein
VDVRGGMNSECMGTRGCEQIHDEGRCAEPIVLFVSLESDTCITRYNGFAKGTKEENPYLPVFFRFTFIYPLIYVNTVYFEWAVNLGCLLLFPLCLSLPCVCIFVRMRMLVFVCSRVYMCMCLCVYVCIIMHLCMCVCVCVCMCICACVHVCVYVCMCMYFNAWVCMCMCAHGFMCVCVCMCVHECVDVWMCVCGCVDVCGARAQGILGRIPAT